MKLKNTTYKSNIALSIFLMVNFLFALKYIARISPYYASLSLGIVSFYLLFWLKRETIIKKIPGLKKLTIFILSTFLLFGLIIFKLIDVESLNVDRWSVITSFWDNYFKGDYVYLAKSNVGNYPGPMPFYFILALPFYFLKELGLLSLMGAIAFYYFLEKTVKPNPVNHIVLLLSLISLPYLWEVVCRSNVFFNGTIVLAVLVFFNNQNTFNAKKAILTGSLIGLVLSTRNVFVIPFIIAFVYAMKSKKITLKETLLIGIATVIAFGITFVPFIWNHFDAFLTMNPFIIQSSFLMPFKFTLFFIFTAFIAGLYCKTENEVYLYSGIVLFCTIAFYFIYWIYLLGYQKTFVDSFADISYFILCLPFALYYLVKEN